MSTPVLSLHGEQRALFASDLHAGEHDPATTQRFIAALQAQARDASHVFLLGDLFEAWVGDDQRDAVADGLVDCLAALAAGGRALFLMRGNRDFLVDAPVPAAPSAATLSARCGARLLPDPCVIDLFGRRTLLAHGDALCTDDADYQRLRATLRDPAWQAAFLGQPIGARLAYARELRGRSEHDKAVKAEYLMDVNPQAVATALRDADARVLVHGHTHRPARHTQPLDGGTAERWVLPDWEAAGGRGGFLVVDADGWRAEGNWSGDPTA